MEFDIRFPSKNPEDKNVINESEVKRSLGSKLRKYCSRSLDIMKPQLICRYMLLPRTK